VAVPHLHRRHHCPTRLVISSRSLQQYSGSDILQNPDLVAGHPGSVSFSYVSALRTHLVLITCVSQCPCHVSGFVCFLCCFLTVSVSVSLCLVLCLLIIMLCLSYPYCLCVCLVLVSFRVKGAIVEYDRMFLWGAAIES